MIQCVWKITLKEIVMIKISNLNKIYKSKKRSRCHALKDINLILPDSGLIFVLGKSGSGKSTLLNLIGGLDNITSGSIEVDGNDLAKFKEKDFCNYRNTHIGFIFQDYHLIDELTVYENVVLSLNLRQTEDADKVKQALAKVDLAGYENRYPSELSGGEQQRVAIARAIVKKPRIILADEPTGNLDTNTATAIITLLKELSKECLILIVSHNLNDANNYADRVIELRKGEVISDKTRNPEFLDEVSLQDDELIYPQGLALSVQDIRFINENKSKNLKLKTDKFLPTNEPKVSDKKIKIENKSLPLFKKFELSGKFLKNKTLAIALSAFMVAVIMVIMALAQTIINFDANKILSDEMRKNNQSNLVLNKYVDEETQMHLDHQYRVEITEEDVQALYEAGYKGKIYPLYNLSVIITRRNNAVGAVYPFFEDPRELQESVGTLIVDEQFLIEKYGKLEYLAKAETPISSGLIITDYVADSILKANSDYKTYDDVVGIHYYAAMWTAPQLYINGVIDTGYKERYAELFNLMEKNPTLSTADYAGNEDFNQFINEIYTSLAISYTFNENIFKDYENVFDEKTDATYMLWPNRLVVNDSIIYPGSSATWGYIVCEREALTGNQIKLSYVTYNELFGTAYTRENLNTFVPHEIKLSQYRYYDYSFENPLFEEKLLITELMPRDAGSSALALFVSEEIYEKFERNNFYAYGLYLDGTDGVGAVLDTAQKLNFQQQNYTVEGVHTMTRAVDVFIPIFELIAIILCVGVVFILMNFSSKMIGDKMHEIGILKALGAKNTTIAAVFGLQVVLIALLTCVLSTAGYFFFIDLANDVLIESLKRLAPSHIVLDLEFLTFQPAIATLNCGIVLLLALVSLISPMLKIKMIKPVKIIKAKD